MLAAHLNLLEFSGFILCGGLLAGLLGSLTGLGGGVRRPAKSDQRHPLSLGFGHVTEALSPSRALLR